MRCPLCLSRETVSVNSSSARPRRRFRRCQVCALLFVEAADHLSAQDERDRYLKHRNSREDAGYVSFLSQLLDPVLAWAPEGGRGLDFGCGPVPVLAELARERGVLCDAYDPYFHPALAAPVYDFVLASEVFEHFRQPAVEIRRVLRLLRAGGILGVMTEWRRQEWWQDGEAASWHYTSDPTHVAFYHESTFDWIAERFRLKLLYKDGARVIVLRRPASSPECQPSAGSRACLQTARNSARMIAVAPQTSASPPAESGTM